MSSVTVARATPHIVTWRVGNSLHIESTRSAVDTWADEADFMGHVNVDGLILTPGDLANMRAAMDDAVDAVVEKRHERAAEFDS